MRCVMRGAEKERQNESVRKRARGRQRERERERSHMHIGLPLIPLYAHITETAVLAQASQAGKKYLDSMGSGQLSDLDSGQYKYLIYQMCQQ